MALPLSRRISVSGAWSHTWLIAIFSHLLYFFPSLLPTLCLLQHSGQHGSYEGDYDQLEFSGRDPFPVSAKRGQALVFTQGEPTARDKTPSPPCRRLLPCCFRSKYSGAALGGRWLFCSPDALGMA